VFGVPSIDPVIANANGTGLLQLKSSQFSNPQGVLIPSGVMAGNCTQDRTPSLDPVSGSVNTGQYVGSKPGRYTDDQVTATWDREFCGGNNKVSARFFLSNAESFLPFGAGGLQASRGGILASSINANDLDFPYDLPVNDRFFAVSNTHLFSSAVVNDLRFGYVRINNSLINLPAVTVDDLGIDRPTNNVTKSIYKFSLTSFQIGPTPPADRFQTQNNYSVVDSVSWVNGGAHVFRFGGEYTRVNLDKLFPQVFNGQIVFFFNSLSGGLTDWQKFLEGIRLVQLSLRWAF
jgi:hypothetical protein